MKQVNALIRITRLRKGYKAAALAHECGITASYLSQIESGKEVDSALTSILLQKLGLVMKARSEDLCRYDKILDDFSRPLPSMILTRHGSASPFCRRLKR